MTTVEIDRQQLVNQLAKIAAEAGGGAGLLLADEAAALLELLESARTPGYEGWADIELMGHRSRIAYVRELELARRGFLELTWDEGDVAQREIYSPSAVFSLTPLDDEAAANALREARDRDRQW